MARITMGANLSSTSYAVLKRRTNLGEFLKSALSIGIKRKFE
jgi:hypothetical protein